MWRRRQSVSPFINYSCFDHKMKYILRYICFCADTLCVIVHMCIERKVYYCWLAICAADHYLWNWYKQQAFSVYGITVFILTTLHKNCTKKKEGKQIVTRSNSALRQNVILASSATNKCLRHVLTICYASDKFAFFTHENLELFLEDIFFTHTLQYSPCVRAFFVAKLLTAYKFYSSI